MKFKLLILMINLVKSIFINCYEIINVIKNILRILDCDMRANIYIGITGFLTAIVIFVAEFVSNDEKSKLDKKVLMKKTNILENITFMIFNMTFLWLEKIFGGCLYYIFQLTINGFIILSIIKTLNMFRNIIELTLRDDYLAIERDNYIKDVFDSYNNERNKLDNLKEKSKQNLKNKLDNNKLVQYNEYSYYIDGYISVISKYEGILKKIDIEKINSVIEMINNEETNNQNSNENKINEDKIIVYISSAEGDFVNSKTPIFYIKKSKREYSDYILANFKIEKDEKHLDEDVSNIIKEKIDKIKNTNYYNNISNEISDFFEKIIIDDYNYVEEILYNYVYNTAKEATRLKDINLINNLYEVLEDFCLLSCKNNKLPIFEKYYEMLYLIIVNEINLEKNLDIREITFKYVKTVNSCIYRILNLDTKNKFYDVILSQVLRLTKMLFYKNEMDAVYVIYDNIYINRLVRKENYDIEEENINFQFLIGILYAVLYEYDSLKQNKFKGIKNILQRLNEKLEFRFEENEIFFKFKENIDKKSKIHSVYNNYMFGNYEDYKYKLSWIASGLNTDNILVCLLQMYPYIYNDTFDVDKVDKDDRFLCENLLQLLNSSKYDDLYKEFPCSQNIYISEIKKYIGKIKKLAEEKEDNYIISNKLEMNKVNNFKEKIFLEIEKGNDILSLLQKYKIEYSNNVPKKYLICENILLPRNIFFEEVSGYEEAAISYADGINNGKSKAIIDYLVKNAKKETDINVALSKLKVLDNIIIFAGFKKMKKFKYKDEYEFDGTKIPVMRIQEDNIIIFDKSSLPIIEYMGFNKKETQNGEIRNHTFIQFFDYPNQEEIVDNTINFGDKFKQKFDTEEDMKKYLKKHCIVKVCQSVRLKEAKEKNIYIIE